MAAYIELNAVRAGLVEDPKDYRFCGYAEAVAGHEQARQGLGVLLGIGGGDSVGWNEVSKRYRMLIFDEGGTSVFRREDVLGVLESGGTLRRSDLLRCRVRYFSDGMILGCRAFVDDVFEHRRSHFGSRRKTGARKMRGGDWGELYVARDLKKGVIG